jgi:hypothetical protein
MKSHARTNFGPNIHEKKKSTHIHSLNNHLFPKLPSNCQRVLQTIKQ